MRANVVDLTDFALLEHHLHGTVVVFDMDPISNVATVTVERHFVAIEQVRGEQRNEFLWELVRPIVVRASSHHHGQPVGRHITEGDEVAARFGSRVRAARHKAVRFLERPDIDRAIGFVGGNVHKPLDV